MSECEWNFGFYENSVKLSSVKLSKKAKNEEYVKGTTIFVFEFLFFTIFITYIHLFL